MRPTARAGGWSVRPAGVRTRPHALSLRWGFHSEQPPPGEQLPSDLAFLARQGVSSERLRVVAHDAAAKGTEPSRELIATGFASPRYWALLADDLGLAFIDDLCGAEIVSNAGLLTTQAVRDAASVMVERRGERILVLAPQPHQIALLRRRLIEAPALKRRLAIATPEAIRAFLVAHRHATLSHYAVRRLAHVLPSLSAAGQCRGRGLSNVQLLVAVGAALSLLAPATAAQVAPFLLTLFFLNCSIWKLVSSLSRPPRLRLEAIPDRRLPAYTVMVPLYREASVTPDLVVQMRQLDYPAAKLQILLIVEADDIGTRQAASGFVGSTIEMVVVPPGGPRTKPKALAYALPFVRGDYVVVFDAEDRPEPDQLRKAAAAFHDRPDLGCVQARLTPDNHGSWFARMFTLEYAANFEVLLPALADLEAPLPLGGTSNHFPRRLLEKVLAWDPYNVTEDADLGIRLARFGYRSVTLLSRTYEEAPVTFRQWLPQRRRWIKGWMQTIAPCLRGGMPRGLRLSLYERLAVHGILTAGVLGLLLYPVSLAAIAVAVIVWADKGWPEGPYPWALVLLNFGNLAAVFVASATSAARGLRMTRTSRLVWHIPMLPAYWALMSLAAWQALDQFFRRPSQWEKTTHGVARDRRRHKAPLPA